MKRIPDSLRRIKPSCELESVPVSRLARKGSEVLSQITATGEAVAIKVQGMGSMVTMSRTQYDAMVEQLLQADEGSAADDAFRTALARRFDAIAATWDRPDFSSAVDRALFDNEAGLNASYRPGATETTSDDKD